MRFVFLTLLVVLVSSITSFAAEHDFTYTQSSGQLVVLDAFGKKLGRADISVQELQKLIKNLDSLMQEEKKLKTQVRELEDRVKKLEERANKLERLEERINKLERLEDRVRRLESK